MFDSRVQAHHARVRKPLDWRSPAAAANTGSAGVPTSASGPGARFARTTAPTATPGTTSRTITRGRAPIAGTRTASAGICDRHQHICFALALWNGRDPILKERLFGLTGNEGNHGEDVKEYYFYLDSTPTHSYMKFLYKYPQAAFPYGELVEENRRRDKHATGVRAARHRRVRRRPLLRRLRRIRQGRRRRHPDPHHRDQPRSGSRADSTCCRRSGSATPGRGQPTSRTPSTVARPPATRRSSFTSKPHYGRRWLYATARRSCSSPRTRRTPSASSATPNGPPLREGRHQRLHRRTDEPTP